MENGLPVLDEYAPGTLTLRGLHYQLVALGMTNDIRHYKKVVSAMINARWDRTIPFDAFVDHDRETIGATKFEQTDVASTLIEAKSQIRLWARSYSKNRWENQPIYPEVFIEKKALQGVFDFRECSRSHAKTGTWHSTLARGTRPSPFSMKPVPVSLRQKQKARPLSSCTSVTMIAPGKISRVQSKSRSTRWA
jgi:hypothetical protein